MPPAVHGCSCMTVAPPVPDLEHVNKMFSLPRTRVFFETKVKVKVKIQIGNFFRSETKVRTLTWLLSSCSLLIV